MMLYWRILLQTAEQKIKTYFGFSIKSKTALFGYDNIKKYTKPIYLIVICSSMSESNIAKLTQYGTNKKITTLQLNEDVALEELLHKPNVKAVGVLNDKLAKQIELNLQENNMTKRGNF